jgi:hydroxymethylglutaryl-CoA lyase
MRRITDVMRQITYVAVLRGGRAGHSGCMTSTIGTAAVEIVEVGPRDGLQNEATLLPTQTKVELIRRAIAAGARRLEAASFVHPKLVPQMADGEAVMEAVLADGFLPDGVARESVTFIGLVLNPRGLARAQAAGVDEINVVVAASEGFARANQNAGVGELIEAASSMAADARAAGLAASVVISTAFGCPFDGEVPVKAVLDVAGQLIEAGFTELAIADTIGVGVPTQVRELVAGIRAIDDGVRLRAHFHNTRNTGYANAIAAVEAGVRVLDSSVGGIGGCPFAPNATGNIATEDLVYLLHRTGHPTGVDLPAMAGTGTWIADQLGRQAPALLGRAGGFPPS